MTRAEFISGLRFAFCDNSDSNQIQREKLSDRPGNIFDGQNRGFFLFNRRISAGPVIYDGNNTVISGTTTNSATGFIFFSATAFPTPPQDPNLYTDYSYQKLNDTEIDQAVKLAEATGGFDSNNLSAVQVDFATMYALFYCYTAAASRASEYYSLSAAGKQVSKSELFNHYNALAASSKQQADALRLDFYTDRGQRNIPGDASSAPSYAQPYIGDSGGG
jgi:hypothetical protein